MFAVKPLALPDIRRIYQAHITRDFPPDERKPLAAIEAACARGEYQCFGAYEEEQLAAYAFFVKLRRSGETRGSPRSRSWAEPGRSPCR